ncbi:MAG TPA: LPS export ABC transporter permease LptG [Smithella sp.]|nr:LPS export ABC transporter permease LptG [Smithella sp.]
MKILDKYILKEFLKFFVITFFSFILLFLIVDFFEKIRMFLSNHASANQMASYFAFSIPMIIYYILPPAILLSTLMTFGTFSKHNEITAMKANGIPIYRIAFPLVIFGACAAVFLFYFSELIVPASIQKTQHIIKIEIQKRKTLGYFKQNEIWYRSGNAIYNFKFFDADKNILKGVTINYLNPDFALNSRIDAKRAEWKNDHWVFYDVLEIHQAGETDPVLERTKEKVINIPERPEDFKVMQTDAENMGYFALKKYIRKIKSEGYNVIKYQVALYSKIAFPFITIIMIFLAIPFSLRSERSGGIMQSAGVAVFIGFSYWIVNAVFVSLGKSELLPAALAAWTANILFSTVAAILFYKAKT